MLAGTEQGNGQSRAEEILQADVSDVVSSAAATPVRDGDWHTEARVQAMLIKYLHREGWEIVRSADTARRERGIDVEATRGIETVAIEVKGFPGRNYADLRRAGERERTQPSTQAKGWYGRAILAAMIVRTQRPAVRAIIAFPDFPRYRELYRQTAGQLQKCDIELWWITREGNVTVAAPQPELASAIQRMIGECLGHASELRKHPQDAPVWPGLARTLWVRASGDVSARQPRFSVKILTNRG